MAFIGFDLEMIERQLQSLDKNTQPLWGSMDATKMLEHLILVTQVSNGKKSIRFAGKEEYLPKLHAILKSDKPFPQNHAAPPDVEGYMAKSSGKAISDLKKDLLKELSDFELHFQNKPNMEVTNAVFGPLNFEEWKYFHQKHISHHLAQFACWEY